MTATKREHRIGSAATSDPMDTDVVADDMSVPEVSLYDALRQSLAQKVEVKEVAYDVPNRPQMAMVFRPDFDFDLYQAWLKKAEDRKTKEPDFMKLSIMVISNTNVGIHLNGQLVTKPDDGEALRITSPEIHQFLKVPTGSVGTAIRKLYGADGHVIQTCRNVVEKAGYSLEGDVLEASDDGPLDR